jgi:hypothetical protein
MIVGGALATIGVIAFAQLAPSEGDKAAEAYEQARISGASMTQLCRSAKAVEQEYRFSKDNAKAEQWALYARVDCNSASLIEGYRPY